MNTSLAAKELTRLICALLFAHIRIKSHCCSYARMDDQQLQLILQ